MPMFAIQRQTLLTYLFLSEQKVKNMNELLTFSPAYYFSHLSKIKVVENQLLFNTHQYL